jgi:hypothetical protein
MANGARAAIGFGSFYAGSCSVGVERPESAAQRARRNRSVISANLRMTRHIYPLGRHRDSSLPDVGVFRCSTHAPNSTASGRDQPFAKRVAGKFGDGARAELACDVAAVHFDRSDCDVQLLGDR